MTAASLSSSERSAPAPEEAVTMFWSSSSRMVRKTTRLSRRSSTMRMFERSIGSDAVTAVSSGMTACGIWAETFMSAFPPGLDDGDQLVTVHRLGKVVRGPRCDAALAVCLHRLGGHGHD